MFLTGQTPTPRTHPCHISVWFSYMGSPGAFESCCSTVVPYLFPPLILILLKLGRSMRFFQRLLQFSAIPHFLRKGNQRVKPWFISVFIPSMLLISSFQLCGKGLPPHPTEFASRRMVRLGVSVYIVSIYKFRVREGFTNQGSKRNQPVVHLNLGFDCSAGLTFFFSSFASSYHCDLSAQDMAFLSSLSLRCNFKSPFYPNKL